MKEITLTEFKKLQLPDLQESACLKVMGNLQLVGYFIVNPQGLMRDRVEGMCSQIDAGRGKA